MKLSDVHVNGVLRPGLRAITKTATKTIILFPVIFIDYFRRHPKP